jgi:hypothetical protein
MNAYYMRWKNNEKGKAGAVMGYTDTACKQMKAFSDYEHTALKSRGPINAALWSDKLMETARELFRERGVEVESTEDEVVEEGEDENEEETSKQKDFEQRTLNALGDSEDDDDNGDSDDDDGKSNHGETDDECNDDGN